LSKAAAETLLMFYHYYYYYHNDIQMYRELGVLAPGEAASEHGMYQ
jgi:hypothetical protein